MRATTLTLFDGPFLLQSPPNPGTFGPVRWWDASSFNDTHGDGSFINPGEPWEDQSSNHSNASSTTGHTPVFRTNVINGRPVVRLQGTKRLLFDSSVSLDNFTVLAIVLTANDSIFLSNSDFNQQIRAERSNVHKSSWFATSGGEAISDTFLSDNTVARMVGYRRTLEPSGITSEFVFFDNSNVVNPASGPTGHPTITFSINQIGIIDGGPLNIDIAELAIYNKSLSVSEIQILYNQYFKPKFALP